MNITDEMLVAFADGELDPKTRKVVMRAVAADPELARKLAAHQRLRETLSNHFAPIAEQAVPEHLTMLLKNPDKSEAPKVVDLAAIRAERAQAQPRRWLPAWGNVAAIAATLVLGLAVGQTMDSSGGPISVSDGAMVADGSLKKTLDTQLASAQGAGVQGASGEIRVGLTFRSKTGSICRTFEGSAMSGLACRADGRWRLEQLLPGAATGSAYRQASSGDPRLAANVQDMIAGTPFDANAERAARDKGWR
ncbi:anti-sigma factor family protein [Rhizorhapis sp. SPR117]|uniref:anti-sigma factor family protein n=1 Tax=Rhizorhapis sp. SPR117 TaxID=2912611 RepID=UPI001F3A07CC|nr:anti-sigma factor [Rhizorhapis sp. SPR117]